MSEKFKVGQVWRTREGGVATITDVVDDGAALPVSADVYAWPSHELYTEGGFYNPGEYRSHLLDLVELIAEQCGTCSGNGTVGHPPDDYGYTCPTCHGAGSVGQQVAHVITLTPAEIQSGASRVRWAETSPLRLAAILREAAGVLSGEKPARGPLADELDGLAGMLERGVA